jgi:hypothetical protein
MIPNDHPSILAFCEDIERPVVEVFPAGGELGDIARKSSAFTGPDGIEIGDSAGRVED